MRAEALIEGDLIMCSHGDLIPEVLNRLLREGMSVIGGRGCERLGLDARGARRDIVSGTYNALLTTPLRRGGRRRGLRVRDDSNRRVTHLVDSAFVPR